jgi:RNA polymerase sigma factor for flagellar operon FliA
MRVEDARRRDRPGRKKRDRRSRGGARMRAVGGQVDGALGQPPPVRSMEGGSMSTDEDSERGPRPIRADTAEELLRRYRRRRSVLLRDQLVERHRSMVEAMARRMASRLPPCVDAQDLVHAGIWGLMQAIDKFQPTRSEVFATFARIRVRGAMLDELRNMDFLPRLYRRRLRDREQALLRLRAELLREPSDAELADELGVTLVTLQRSYVRRGEMHRFAATGTDEDGSAWDTMDLLADDGLESPIEAVSRQELVAKIRQSLQPIEWKVLELHYLEGKSGKEVARQLRLSASRICQIHGRVLDRLKQRLRAAAV